MSVHPLVVNAARIGWKWQWNQLMNGLAPSDNEGNYKRPSTEKQNAIALTNKELEKRVKNQIPRLIIGRSCPWAHRTWLVCEIKGLKKYISLNIAEVDKNGGQWLLKPKWLECNSVKELYQKCGVPPNYRATLPVLIDPGNTSADQPQLICNESTQLIEVLDQWPGAQIDLELAPKHLEVEIKSWDKLLGESVNNGVYKCGFARSQRAYERASEQLFIALQKVEESLSNKGPWLCGKELTLADIRLFPTLIRWEDVYMPLFGCSQRPLWTFPNVWTWRKNLFSLDGVSNTCNSMAWRNDYFGALFPLRPNNIIPKGPELAKIVNAEAPILK